MGDDWKEDYIESHSYSELFQVLMLSFFKFEFHLSIGSLYFILKKLFKETFI